MTLIHDRRRRPGFLMHSGGVREQGNQKGSDARTKALPGECKMTPTRGSFFCKYVENNEGECR